MKTDHILECVFNVSEGRRLEIVEQVATSAKNALLDVHSDPDHNRSVVTIAGRPDALVDGLVEATATAAALIDLSKHDGVHPRIGVMDVVPFVPLFGEPITSAISVAKECSRRIAERLNIPVFIYGPNRSLPMVRKEAFRTISPDFGPTSPHPTAGAVSVGAREVLVAFNVNLDASVDTAKTMAEQLRSLPHVRALGLCLSSKGLSQVSMNLTRPNVTTMPMAFDAVSRLAGKYSVEIVEAELVGLAPLDSVAGRQAESFGLNSPPKILEQELARVFGDQN